MSWATHARPAQTRLAQPAARNCKLASCSNTKHIFFFTKTKSQEALARQRDQILHLSQLGLCRPSRGIIRHQGRTENGQQGRWILHNPEATGGSLARWCFVCQSNTLHTQGWEHTQAAQGWYTAANCHKPPTQVTGATTSKSYCQTDCYTQQQNKRSVHVTSTHTTHTHHVAGTL